MAVEKLYSAKDVHIANHSYGSWYLYQSGLNDAIWLGCWDWPEYANNTNFYAYASRGLIKFNLPEYTAETTIMSAKLKVPFNNGGPLDNPRNAGVNQYNANPTIDIHEVLQEWDEGVGDGHGNGYQYSGATWTTRTANGWGWSSYGGYFNSTPSASLTQNVDSYWWEFDITALVNKWRATPTSNNGIIMKYRNDNIAAGALYTWSKDIGNGQWGPYIEVTYNTPPEKPRGLSPNFGSFICQDLAHSMHFKWTFLDTAAPPARGKADVVFMIDATSSMHWRFPHMRNQINTYITRLENEGVDYNIGIVLYGDVRYGEATRRYGPYSTKASALAGFDTLPRYSGGDYPDTGLEAIMDASNGVASYPWRVNSHRQLMICTDSPMHNRSGVETYYPNASVYELTEVTTWLKNNNIIASIATNTHCGSYTQLRLFPNNTGGQYMEENNNWGDYLTIKTIKSADEQLAFDEGDYQTRADLRIWHIKPDGTRPLIFTYTSWGAGSDISLKGLGAPWEEGASYEWDVVVYDKYGVPSQPSDKGKFTYIIDVNAAIGIPMFRENILEGQTINKKALQEIKDKLYYEVRKYRDLDPGQALTLFESEVVPTRADMTKLKGLMDQMLISDGLPILKEDLVEQSLGVSDVKYIRDQMVSVSMSSPDTPANGTARRSQGMIHRPISIAAKNSSTVDTTIDVSWAPSEYLDDGWLVRLQPSKDTDINYYKFYHEQVIKLTNSTKKILTEVYMKSDQIVNGNVYVPDTGRVDSQSMWYNSHDMNGRSSQQAAGVTFDWNSNLGTAPTSVAYYIVQRQQKHWSANIPDPNGTWVHVYQGGNRSFVDTVWAEGSYWYRVKAVDNYGVHTDWTYSETIAYIRY